MLEFSPQISSAYTHNNARHHTELFEKSNKLSEGNTHSKSYSHANFGKPLQLAFCEEGGEKCPSWKGPSVQTFFVSFRKPLKLKINLSFQMTTKTTL